MAERQRAAEGPPGRNTTIVIHTANRPDQLFRVLRYYSDERRRSACRIFVADGSDADRAAIFDSMMAAADWSIDVDLRRYPNDLPFQQRIRAALSEVTTPFAMLAADDDFYFLNWLDGAVAKMDAEHDVISVVGNSIRFTLDSFQAFSNDISFTDGAPERFKVPWLGADTPQARLGELSANPSGIQTAAWYAVHRTAVIKAIFDHGCPFDLPTLLFERFYAVAQAAAGKTWFSPEIFLARQQDFDPEQLSWRGEPMSFRQQRAALQRLEKCARTYLAGQLGMDEHEAAAQTAKAFASEIAMMRQADRRRVARKLVNRFGLRHLVNRLREAVPPGARDPRLPACCDPEEMRLRSEEVRHACRPIEAASSSRASPKGLDVPPEPRQASPGR